VFVQNVSINGKPLENNLLSHYDIMNGGELVFEMSNQPKQ
jgi:putative alpha-1,2-mannosidase